MNEEKPPVLLLQIMLTKHLHIVYPPLNHCLQTTIDMVCNAGLFGLCTSHQQDALIKTPLPRLSNNNRRDTWMFVHTNQASHHQGAILCPGWAFIIQPLHHLCNNILDLGTGIPGVENPVLNTDHVYPPQSGPSGELTVYLNIGVLRGVNGGKLWRRALLSVNSGG